MNHKFLLRVSNEYSLFFLQVMQVISIAVATIKQVEDHKITVVFIDFISGKSVKKNCMNFELYSQIKREALVKHKTVDKCCMSSSVEKC